MSSPYYSMLPPALTPNLLVFQFDGISNILGLLRITPKKPVTSKFCTVLLELQVTVYHELQVTTSQKGNWLANAELENLLGVIQLVI